MIRLPPPPPFNVSKTSLLSPAPALKVALRRFEMLSDYDNADRILDQIIILEALFSDDDKNELSNKLSLRIANLIGADFDERKQLFKTMKAHNALHAGEDRT
jgi:Apea-like HEPN